MNGGIHFFMSEVFCVLFMSAEKRGEGGGGWGGGEKGAAFIQAYTAWLLQALPRISTNFVRYFSDVTHLKKLITIALSTKTIIPGLFKITYNSKRFPKFVLSERVYYYCKCKEITTIRTKVSPECSRLLYLLLHILFMYIK
jgi:hypothetical protein